jgi:hypothetical protein
MPRPLLLIDIDGVISLSGFDAQLPPAGRFELVEGIPHFLSASAGELLGDLERYFELAWCSGWEEKADEYLPRALGISAGLPHLTFPGPGPDASAARHWKLEAIEAYAGPTRPLAWIDDVFDDSCHAWARMRSGPTKLVLTEPAIGLTAEQARGLEEWARSVLTG